MYLGEQCSKPFTCYCVCEYENPSERTHVYFCDSEVVCGLKKIAKRKEAKGVCRRMNELVKGQWWFSLKTNYWCWEGTAVWLGSNSPATPAEDSEPVHPPHTLPTTQHPTLPHPITPWECCQPGRWGETGSGKDKTPSHWDLNWNKAEVKRGYWESDYSRTSERGWKERMRVAHVWK